MTREIGVNSSVARKRNKNLLVKNKICCMEALEVGLSSRCMISECQVLYKNVWTKFKKKEKKLLQIYAIATR